MHSSIDAVTSHSFFNMGAHIYKTGLLKTVVRYALVVEKHVFGTFFKICFALKFLTKSARPKRTCFLFLS